MAFPDKSQHAVRCRGAQNFANGIIFDGRRFHVSAWQKSCFSHNDRPRDLQMFGSSWAGFNSSGEICYPTDMSRRVVLRESMSRRGRCAQARTGMGAGFGLLAFLFSVLSGPLHAASIAALDANRPPSFAAVAKKTMPVVVNISTSSQQSARSGSNDPIEDF